MNVIWVCRDKYLQCYNIYTRQLYPTLSKSANYFLLKLHTNQIHLIANSMSQHAVLFYAGSNSITDQTQSDVNKLMHAAGLHTHPGNAPSADTDTIEPLVREFGNLFPPEIRRQFFEMEVKKLFCRTRELTGQSKLDFTEFPSHPIEDPHSRCPVVPPHGPSPTTCDTKTRISRNEIHVEKRNSPRRARKSADVYQAGFNWGKQKNSAFETHILVQFVFNFYNVIFVQYIFDLNSCIIHHFVCA